MGIHITMGSEDGLHFIADTNLTVTSNPTYVFLLSFRSKISSQNLNSNKIQEMILFWSFISMSNKVKKKKPLPTLTKHLTKLLKNNKCHRCKYYWKDHPNKKELFKLFKILDASFLIIDSLFKDQEIKKILQPFKLNLINLTRQLSDSLLHLKVTSNTITITEQM